MISYSPKFSPTNGVLSFSLFLLPCRTSWRRYEQCSLRPKAFSRIPPERVPQHPGRINLQLHLQQQPSGQPLDCCSPDKLHNAGRFYPFMYACLDLALVRCFYFASRLVLGTEIFILKVQLEPKQV